MFCIYSIYIVVVILHKDFIVFLLLILSGDVELNPGPVTGRNQQCHVLYSNIRGLYGNLRELIVVSKGFDISLCSETLVSNFRHIAELSIPGFKRPILLKRNEINRAQGWQYILGMVVLPLIRLALNVGAMKLISSKCVANIIISICSLFIGILMLMTGFLIVF